MPSFISHPLFNYAYPIVLSIFFGRLLPLWFAVIASVVSVVLVRIAVVVARVPSTKKREKAEGEATRVGVPLPKVDLLTFPASFYCEKVRWCAALADFPVREQVTTGVLFLLRGTTVPSLSVRLGWSPTSTTVSNSSEILSLIYTWSIRSGVAERDLEWLRPTAARAEWEARIDAVGTAVQGLIYSSINGDMPSADAAALSMRLWGVSGGDPRISWHQVALGRLLNPVQRVVLAKAFGTSAATTAAYEAQIMTLFNQVATATAASSDGYILDGPQSYVDIVFAATAMVVCVDDEYGGAAGAYFRPAHADLPKRLRASVDRFRKHPAAAFARKVFDEHFPERLR
jgi:glutathione S-transferase